MNYNKDNIFSIFDKFREKILNYLSYIFVNLYVNGIYGIWDSTKKHKRKEIFLYTFIMLIVIITVTTGINTDLYKNDKVLFGLFTSLHGTLVNLVFITIIIKMIFSNINKEKEVKIESQILCDIYRSCQCILGNFSNNNYKYRISFGRNYAKKREYAPDVIIGDIFELYTKHRRPIKITDYKDDKHEIDNHLISLKNIIYLSLNFRSDNDNIDILYYKYEYLKGFIEYEHTDLFNYTGTFDIDLFKEYVIAVKRLIHTSYLLYSEIENCGRIISLENYKKLKFEEMNSFKSRSEQTINRHSKLQKMLLKIMEK